MQNENFIEPEESEFLEAFGAERVAIPETAASFIVKIEADATDIVELTYDVIARSVRIRWVRESRAIVDIYKERVSRLSVNASGSLTIISQGVDLADELTVGIYPIEFTEVQLAR